MKPKIFLAAGLLLMMNVVAQQKNKIKFHSINNAGLVSGASDNTLQLQTINGIKYKTYSVGIGIGIDNYYFKTIPLFVEVRKYIFDKKETPFVYIDAGGNLPEKKDESTAWKQTTYHAGLYYDMGIGYKWIVAKQFFVTASFGYSQKMYSGDVEYLRFGNDPEVLPPDKYEYKLQRFTMKLGFGF